MHSFINQFRNARNKGMRLIYDTINQRYLITHKPNWQNWSGCVLIKKINHIENQHFTYILHKFVMNLLFVLKNSLSLHHESNI